MKVDKQNGNVKYNDEDHLYWNEDGKFISVTTLIGKYEQPFDEQFWSAYKALEKLLTKEQFKLEKTNLLQNQKVNLQYFIEGYGLDESKFNALQQDILDEWQRINIESCERGTKIHSDLENLFVGKKTTDLKRFGFGGKFEVNTNKTLENLNKDLLDIDRGIFPEYLIYRISPDKKFRLAGQIDLLVKDGNDLYLIDYKGLPLNTEILTTNGWSTIGNLKEGDYVFDKNGKPTKILHKSKIHNNPCFKIIFDNGDEIISDCDHRWEISFRTQRGGYTTTVLTTKELYEYLQSYTRNSLTIPKILNPDPIIGETKEVLVDPYVLGAWLGDGSKDCGIITQTINSPLWEEIKRRGYEIGENAQHNPERENTEMRTVYGLRTQLKLLGVLNNKTIPNIYYTASYNQRLDLLRGLMDTDGYYHPKRKRFVMATGQEWQRDCMIKLLSTFGIKSTVFEVNKKCGDKFFKGWDVCFSTNGLNPFLIRNQDIDYPIKDKNSFRNIKNVEVVETEPTQCIEVDSPTHTFLCTNKCIVTHNTNKSIDEKSFFDSKTKKNKMMQYPLNNIMDCNKMHYTLQLSTYAWMLQQINPDFKIKELKIIHFDHAGNQNEYVLEYLKDDVERMCRDYKKKLIIEERARNRKPIEF